MPTDVDKSVARASAYLERSRDQRASMNVRRRARQGVEIRNRLGRIALADAAILVAALLFGWVIGPIGMGGALLVMAALIAATLGFAVFPLVPEATPETLNQTPLKLLPARTEQWLEKQRADLSPVAARLVDDISNRLEALAPQLATLNEAEPAAVEVRKLLGEQLPELLKGYARVPQPLRAVERNGRTPDAQLEYSLKLIGDEISEMSARLAEGDLDNLATRGRFLEMKYKDEEL